MKPLLFFFVVVASICVAVAQAPNSSVSVPAKSNAKALAIVRPQPRYPKDATGRRPTGRGIVVMEIDQKTGWVLSAKMEKSTGSKLLDDAAIEAFSHWRFKPGSKKYIHSPISFGR